jgi:hypothetical protein
LYTPERRHGTTRVPAPGPVVWSVRAGVMDRPSRTKSHPAVSLYSGQPGGPSFWASALIFSLIGLVHTVEEDPDPSVGGGGVGAGGGGG